MTRNEELCKYLGIDYFEADDKMIDFYLRCRDAGMDYADADRYAHLNTMFGYDIGMENARQIDEWMYHHDEEVLELVPTNRKLLEKAVRELNVDVDFTNFRTKSVEWYEYY